MEEKEKEEKTRLTMMIMKRRIKTEKNKGITGE